jgi:hypothetical protein
MKEINEFPNALWAFGGKFAVAIIFVDPVTSYFS